MSPQPTPPQQPYGRTMRPARVVLPTVPWFSPTDVTEAITHPGPNR